MATARSSWPPSASTSLSRRPSTSSITAKGQPCSLSPNASTLARPEWAADTAMTDRLIRWSVGVPLDVPVSALGRTRTAIL